MKKYHFFAGLDVSKKTLDLCLILGADPGNYYHCQVANNLKGYLKLLSWIKSHKLDINMGLFILEHTGIYSLIVCMFLKKRNLNYSLIPGIVLKKSLGICRGKNDKKDAYSIARYGFLYREELEPQQIKDELLLKLQVLFSQRKRFVTALKSLRAPVKEMQDMGLNELALIAEENQKGIIDSLKSSLKEIELQMLNLIETDPQFKKQYQLCTSVPGVGMQLATYLLIVTNGFSRFDNSRQLATYAGVAPFPYQSGSSIRGKNKNSPLADKTLKSLLHMGALNIVRLDYQLKAYYEKKKNEGKNAMLVLNAVRNKLLARIMATVNRGTPYVQLANYVS